MSFLDIPTHPRGRPFTLEEKIFIVTLKQYFDRNRPESVPKDSSAQMTADALGIGLATVNRIMASYQKDPQNLSVPPKPKGCPEYAIDASHQEKFVPTSGRQTQKAGTLQLRRS